MKTLGRVGPVGHFCERFSLARLGQDVDEFKRVPVLVEELYRLPREPAHRHLLGALAIDQNLVRATSLLISS